MGRAKAMLPFGPERLLQRVVRLLGEAVSPVVVVAAARQRLPSLPPSVRVVRDLRPSLGPLEGLYAGLLAMRERAEAAFVVGCDAPLLKPALVRHMCALLHDADAVVPVEDGRYHPLAAVYRVRLLAEIEQLRRDDRMRPACLLDLVVTRRVSVSELRRVDPGLESLVNLNRPGDYRAVLDAAGLGGDA